MDVISGLHWAHVPCVESVKPCRTTTGRVAQLEEVVGSRFDPEGSYPPLPSPARRCVSRRSDPQMFFRTGSATAFLTGSSSKAPNTQSRAGKAGMLSAMRGQIVSPLPARCAGLIAYRGSLVL